MSTRASPEVSESSFGAKCIKLKGAKLVADCQIGGDGTSELNHSKCEATSALQNCLELFARELVYALFALNDSSYLSCPEYLSCYAAKTNFVLDYFSRIKNNYRELPPSISRNQYDSR